MIFNEMGSRLKQRLVAAYKASSEVSAAASHLGSLSVDYSSCVFRADRSRLLILRFETTGLWNCSRDVPVFFGGKD